ncbi:MAG: AAA family ATPase, partial [Bacillota bacterium]|nr:AAA family ATPase [Bacillota bacterium]
IEELIKASEDLNFQVKPLENGFTFIPVKDGEMLSETNFNHLEREEKNKLFQDVDYLKKLSKEIIDYIDENEENYVDDIKLIFKNYLNDETKSIMEINKIADGDAEEYLNFIISKITEEAVDEFSLKYDENYKDIEAFIDEFGVKVITDNENIKHSPVIYQDKPSLNNLFGKIEYVTQNSVYTTDISMFTAGEIIRANEGCLIMNINDILYFRNVYYYLKKTFLNSKVDFDWISDSNEILPLKTIKLDSIPIDEKLILIGDYNSFSLLKAYDEEFSKLFPIVIQVNPFININPYNNMVLKNKILKIIKDNNLLPINEDGITEIFKYLSRKIEDRKKLYYKYDELKDMLIKADFYASLNKQCIGREDIIKANSVYEIYEDSLYDEYLDNKILFNVNGKSIGEINGLSVLQTALKTIGRPIKITCSLSSGEGKIYDIHKESSLSGKIHTKSISILKGYLNTLIDINENIPVDFHINFEQVYSLIDGDSASVAEAAVIISSLCKIGINQNIAVTGSINQFGYVQPIGGVNEKIEGFYKVCSLIDSPKGKGVLIPKINKKDLVLDEKIITDIEMGDFHIYTMETVEEALIILLNIKSIEEIKDIIKKGYKKRKSR